MPLERTLRALDRDGLVLVIALGAVFAAMNASFYVAIDRLPLALVAAIAVAAIGVYLLTHVRLSGEPVGIAFAFANAALFTVSIALAHRLARRAVGSVDGLAVAMAAAFLFIAPIGAAQAWHVVGDPVAIAAGVGVSVSSSVIPYVFDQLAMARLSRATYALFVSLLPATAAVIGVVVLRQFPTRTDLAGIALVMAGIALHSTVVKGSRPARARGPVLHIRRRLRSG